MTCDDIMISFKEMSVFYPRAVAWDRKKNELDKTQLLLIIILINLEVRISQNQIIVTNYTV